MHIDASIIIPTYNVSPYIARAVNSAMGQEGVSVEVIVVDNGSTDGTLDILETLDDHRLKIIRLPENLGPGAARNEGLRAARGRWVAILDGDDCFTSDRLRRLIDLAEKKHADIAVDNLLVVPETQEKPYPMFTPALFNNINAIELLPFMAGPLEKKGHPLSYLKPVFSSEFLKRNGVEYDAGLWVGEDYLIMAHCLILNGKCIVDHNTGYRWTKRLGSVSSRIPSTRWQMMINAEEIFAKKYNLKGELRRAQDERIGFMNKMKIYEQAIESLKRREIFRATKIIFENPQIIPLFKEPLANRLPAFKKRNAS